MTALRRLQAARDAADRLRRHRPRPDRWRRSRGRFPSWPTRWSRRPWASRGGGCRPSTAARRDARRRAGPVRACWRWASSAAIELNYSSDIDLIFLYDGDGQTDGAALDDQPRVLRAACPRPGPAADRADRRWAPPTASTCGCGPRGAAGRSCTSVDQMPCTTTTCGAAPGSGRPSSRPARSPATSTWATRLLEQLEPWIYRRYLSLADITGIKALKRRIEQRPDDEGGRRTATSRPATAASATSSSSSSSCSCSTAATCPSCAPATRWRPSPSLRTAGCLTRPGTGPAGGELQLPAQDRAPAADHVRPANAHAARRAEQELRKLAIRMGYADSAQRRRRWRPSSKTTSSRRQLNRKILDHLLHDAFGDDGEAEPEVDLVLDPEPRPERIRECWARYPFRDVPAAYANLMALADEKIRFLSTRRCRHFLASIAPRLLRGHRRHARPRLDAGEPQPGERLAGRQGGAVGAVQLQPASLDLYVTLCAACPYLAGILTSNPGMIDELMDSLVLDKLPTLELLEGVAGRAVPRGGGPRADPAQLQERPAPARRRARHPGQGRRRGHARGPVGHRRGLPRHDRRARVRHAGREVRRADHRPPDTPEEGAEGAVETEDLTRP